MYADTTSVITALSSLILAFGVLITAYATYRNGQHIKQGNIVGKDIQFQVTTLNGKTLAVLADNDETRRIYAIPKSERTEGDDQHIADVPTPD